MLLLGSNILSTGQENVGSKTFEELKAAHAKERNLAIMKVTVAYDRALDRLKAQSVKDGNLDDAMEILRRKEALAPILQPTEIAANDSSSSAKSNPLAETFENKGATKSPGPPITTPTMTSTTAAKTVNNFDPAGSEWIWSAPTARFKFGPDGTGIATYLANGNTNSIEHSWERKGPRKFLVTRPDLPHVIVMFEILSDGETAVYNNLSGSSFKRMVSRIPN